MSGIKKLFTDAGSVETYLGRTGSGVESWAAPAPKAGAVNDQRRLILSATGEQIVSESTWYTDIADVDLYPLKSKVTVNGRAAVVLQVKRREEGPAKAHHLEVSLT